MTAGLRTWNENGVLDVEISRRLTRFVGSFITGTSGEEETEEPTKRFIYDLYGVSNHYGSLNGGHYTAFCKNPIAGKWYEFDDSQVSKVGNSPAEVQEGVCTKAAYVLFYRLRK